MVPKNTANANKAGVNLLGAYLTEKNMESNFESFSALRMAETLCHFYMDIRTKNGKLYKATTMMNNRYALNRYLKSPPHLKKYDIITGTEFSEANECFKTAMTEIKAVERGTLNIILK